MKNLNSTPVTSDATRITDKALSRTLGKSTRRPYDYEAVEAEVESGRLLDYWNVLRRRKRTVAFFAILGALLGLLFTFTQTPLYQARTSVEIVGLNDNFLNFKEASPVEDSGPTLELSDIQTQIKLLESESLLARVISKLTSDPSVVVKLPRFPDLRELFHLTETSSANPRERVLKNIAKALKIRSAGQTRIIEMTVDSASAQLAAKFANTLVDEFVEQNLEARWTTTQRTSDWLSHQLDDMRLKLERSEDALQTYARKSGLIFTDDKTSVSADKLKQLQIELSAATADRIAKQSRFEMAQSSPADSLPDVLNDEALRLSRGKITELKGQIADLRSTYTADYSKVKKLQAELSTLQSEFEHDRNAIISRINNDYEEAQRRETLLSIAYNAQTAELTGEGERSIQYNILKREADSNRQLYESMLQQLKESSIAAAMRASNIRIVDRAQVPKRPYKPSAVEDIAVGFLASMLLGALFVIARDRDNLTIHHPGDARAFLQLPELGVIPSGSTTRRTLGGRLGASASSSNLEAFEIKKSDPQSCAIAESFRSTLISILFAAQNGSSAKVLVVTSAEPCEGKSTVSSNLAIATAKFGHRVLLIDGDMRRPRQHEIFSLNNDRGLSNLLRERIELNGDSLLSGSIRESDVPGLFVLPSGPEIPDPTSLLYGSRVKDLLQYLRNHFDTILIDTPPMLPVPDARLLGRVADTAILVIRSRHAARESVLAARERLMEDGTTILGTILNDWNPTLSSTEYRYRLAYAGR